MKRAARISARLLIVSVLICGAGLDFIALIISTAGKPTALQRAAWLHRFSRKAVKHWKIGVTYSGQVPAAGLIVSNHLSYLDILLFSSIAPCTFVSKAEVRSWPIVGISAVLCGAIFVDRESPRATVNANRRIENALRAGVPVVLFAEGTSTHGSSVLPFRSPMMQSVVEAKAPLTPACISYQLEDGSVADDICYWGDHIFFPHILKLLTRKGISGGIRFGGPLQGIANRKQAAALARESVIHLLES